MAFARISKSFFGPSANAKKQMLSYSCLELVISEFELIKLRNYDCKLSKKLKKIISHYNR